MALSLVRTALAYDRARLGTLAYPVRSLLAGGLAAACSVLVAIAGLLVSVLLPPGPRTVWEMVGSFVLIPTAIVSGVAALRAAHVLRVATPHALIGFVVLTAPVALRFVAALHLLAVRSRPALTSTPAPAHDAGGSSGPPRAGRRVHP